MTTLNEEIFKEVGVTQADISNYFKNLGYLTTNLTLDLNLVDYATFIATFDNDISQYELIVSDEAGKTNYTMYNLDNKNQSVALLGTDKKYILTGYFNSERVFVQKFEYDDTKPANVTQPFYLSTI